MRDYLEAGTRLVWVVAPEARTATAYRADGSAQLLTERDSLQKDSIDIHREPRAGAYTSLRTARRGETVSPLAFPRRLLRVDDILG